MTAHNVEEVKPAHESCPLCNDTQVVPGLGIPCMACADGPCPGCGCHYCECGEREQGSGDDV